MSVARLTLNNHELTRIKSTTTTSLKMRSCNGASAKAAMRDIGWLSFAVTVTVTPKLRHVSLKRMEYWVRGAKKQHITRDIVGGRSLSGTTHMYQDA